MKNLTLKAVSEMKKIMKDNAVVDTATSCVFEYGYTVKKENGKVYFVIGHKEENLREILKFIIKKYHQYQMILNGIKDCRFINNSVCL